MQFSEGWPAFALRAMAGKATNQNTTFDLSLLKIPRTNLKYKRSPKGIFNRDKSNV